MSNHSAIPPNSDLDPQAGLHKLESDQEQLLESLSGKAKTNHVPQPDQPEIRAEVIEAFAASTQEFASLYKALAK